MSALPSCYKNDTDHWLPGWSACRRNITEPAKQNYCFFPRKLSYGWQNLLNLRNTSQNTGKFRFGRSWRLTLDTRAMRGVTILNSGSYSKCIHVHLNFIKITEMSHSLYRLFVVILHVSFLFLRGSLGKATGLTWVLAQKGWQTLCYSICQEEGGIHNKGRKDCC